MQALEVREAGFSPDPSSLLGSYACLLALIRHRLPRHLNGKAEDLTQETMLAVWSALRGGRSDIRDPVRYMQGIARRRCAEAVRNDLRARIVALESIPEDDLIRPFAAVSAECELLQHERRRQLRRALAKLRPVELSLLHLRFVDGLRNGEACARLGLAPAEGSRLQYRALARLRVTMRRERDRPKMRALA